MLGALREVVSSAVVGHAQCVSQVISRTPRKFVDNVRAWHNGPVDHIGQAQLLFFLDWPMPSSVAIAETQTQRIQLFRQHGKHLGFEGVCFVLRTFVHDNVVVIVRNPTC